MPGTFLVISVALAPRKSCEFRHAGWHVCRIHMTAELHCTGRPYAYTCIAAGCTPSAMTQLTQAWALPAPASLLLVHLACDPLNFQGGSHPHVVLSLAKWLHMLAQEKTMYRTCFFSGLMSGKGCWTTAAAVEHTVHFRNKFKFSPRVLSLSLSLSFSGEQQLLFYLLLTSVLMK